MVPVWPAIRSILVAITIVVIAIVAIATVVIATLVIATEEQGLSVPRATRVTAI
jgi:hypothetical protein